MHDLNVVVALKKLGILFQFYLVSNGCYNECDILYATGPTQ